MADIQQNLENIKSAIYGEEVRGSIRDAIESMNDELVSTTAGLEAATDAANASAANANVAADSANNAASAANAAAGLANTATGSANAAAQNADATASRAGKVLEDCTTATGAANTATINANAAAGSAASAAGSASAAAQNATDFANAAQQAASDANDASAAANTAAARANAAANNAENIGGVSEKTVEFIEASERKNIESGEDVKTVFGKVKKWFSSLGTAAFATVSNVLNVESPGYVMDARQGKVLKDLIDVLEAGVGDLTALETTDKDNLVSAINNLSTAISSLNNKTVPDTTPMKSGDILSITTERNGIWYFASVANGVTGIPEGTWGMVKYNKITDGLIHCMFVCGDTGNFMTNVYQNGNFSGWK